MTLEQDKYAFTSYEAGLLYIDQRIEQHKESIRNLEIMREEITQALAQKAIQESLDRKD